MQRGAEPARERDHRPRSVHIRGALRVLVGGDVVDGGAVHHVTDCAHAGNGVVGEAEIVRCQVADQRPCSVAPGRRPRSRAFRTSSTTPVGQGPKLRRRGPVQNSRDDSAANKPGTAGNDIHAVMLVGRPANVNAM